MYEYLYRYCFIRTAVLQVHVPSTSGYTVGDRGGAMLLNRAAGLVSRYL